MGSTNQDGGLVAVLFLKGQSENEHVINWLTAVVGGFVHGTDGMCHAEIHMSHNNAYMSSSIYQNETVSLTTAKTFANPEYIVKTLAVNKQEMRDIKSFVQSRHAEGVGFDRIGMFLSALPIQLWPRWRGKTFCSRYITEALQAGGLECVAGVNPAIVTPTKLYKLLSVSDDNRNVAGSVSFKQAALGTRANFSGLLVPPKPLQPKTTHQYSLLA